MVNDSVKVKGHKKPTTGQHVKSHTRTPPDGIKSNNKNRR